MVCTLPNSTCPSDVKVVSWYCYSYYYYYYLNYYNFVSSHHRIDLCSVKHFDSFAVVRWHRFQPNCPHSMSNSPATVTDFPHFFHTNFRWFLHYIYFLNHSRALWTWMRMAVSAMACSWLSPICTHFLWTPDSSVAHCPATANADRCCHVPNYCPLHSVPMCNRAATPLRPMHSKNSRTPADALYRIF